MKNNSVIKLFYQNSRIYRCKSDNWGNAKGKQYEKVCVVLNAKAKKLMEAGASLNLEPLSRNKLYVALTRSLGDVYLLNEDSEAIKNAKI